MHSFLRAIGFSSIHSDFEMDEILDEAIDQPNRIQVCKDSYGNELAEMTKAYSREFGIRIYGRFVDNDDFEVDYYYPYFLGEGITTHENMEVERRVSNESYAGISDELKVGVALIYHIQNVAEYLNELSHNANCLNNATVTLSGLSTSGKIILPVEKRNESDAIKQSQSRNHRMAAARDGDEEAMESLTIEDIDTYTMLSKRIATEDVLSIVETTFMPYGVESDQYMIIGEIERCNLIQNQRSQEEIYEMTVNTNDLRFDICINKEDLLGEPAAGRRFKGNIWLQGKINFTEG